VKKFVSILIIILSFSVAAAQESDHRDVEQIFGMKATLQGNVFKVTFPRSDLKVTIGKVKVEAALALTSWAGFDMTSGFATVMGDLVLTADEVLPVVKKLEERGITITALHNHLIGTSRELMYLHFSGSGEPSKLAEAIKYALSATSTPMRAEASSPSKTGPDWSEVENIIGYHGMKKGKFLQLSIPRKEKITEKGMEVPPSMGTAIAINFQAVGEKAATSGDFVLLADEVNPVIKAITESGITVTAVHSHMITEEPRIFFLHFWGYDRPINLAKGLRAALDKVNVKSEKAQ
jgi:hypothetical protein